MFIRKNVTDWHWVIDFEHTVDFAIWILKQDGLHVPPFNQHPTILGNRLVTKLGLSKEQWERWFYKLVVVSTQQPVFVEPDPIPHFSGSQEVATQLAECWELYKPISGSRSTCAQLIADPSRSEMRAMWKAVHSAAHDIPPVNVLLSAYPYYVELAIPPSNIIFAPGGRLIMPRDIKNILLRGIESFQRFDRTTR